MGTGIDPSQNIIQQIAAIEGLEPAELEPPLYEVIDPHALDALVRTQSRTRTIGVVREPGVGGTDSEIGTDTETDTEAETGTETRTETETGAGTEPEPGTDTDTVNKDGVSPEIDSETGTETAYTPTAGLSQIVFTYRGHRIQVDGTGAVEITPHQPPESGSTGSTEDVQSD
ncbi:HalOD1 output domain-containing protein [Natrialba sp. SSL1]|uniref:HalOD1 output domain-containing protein n=1 Tax=Natrialba sp. SSL1 TaxID=1869245 RepID=UPI0008F81E79|nr:HalOD1 output domain-containing protein [Natrialba sp. SSL1]OIB58892.1 hypothetical protein BBD46_06725 [Natrialba sp. SSL1]